VATQTLTNPDCRRVRVAELEGDRPKLTILDFKQGAGSYCEKSHRAAAQSRSSPTARYSVAHASPAVPTANPPRASG
jgi:hypothetical protein